MIKGLNQSFATLAQPGTIPSLDGLRALAILLVITTHTAQIIPGFSWVFWNTEWATPLYNGWMGVDLFFVLSGFLIGGMLIKDIQEERFSLFSFYQRRFLRILPAYFLVIALVIMTQKFFPTSTFLQPYSLKSSLLSFFLLTDYFPVDLAVGSWSLSIEEHFYIFLPFFLLLFPKTKTRLKLILTLFSLALLFRMLTYRSFGIVETFPIETLKRVIYAPFHTRMDALAIGVLIAVLKNSYPQDSGRYIALTCAWLGLTLAGFVYLTGALQGGFFNTTIQYSLVSLGFGGILWAVLEKQPSHFLQKCFAHPFWTPIARLSYSAYLVNVLVIKTLAQVFILQRWSFVFVVVSCFIGALPLYLLIEHPFHQLGKRLGKLRRPELATLPA